VRFGCTRRACCVDWRPPKKSESAVRFGRESAHHLITAHYLYVFVLLCECELWGNITKTALKRHLISTVYATPLMTPTTALGLSIRPSTFELLETDEWDIFLGPPERARAETGRADQWVLKRRECSGFARVNKVTSASLGYPPSVFNKNSTLKPKTKNQDRKKCTTRMRSQLLKRVSSVAALQSNTLTKLVHCGSAKYFSDPDWTPISCLLNFAGGLAVLQL